MSAQPSIQTSDAVMRLCRFCADIAREKKLEESDALMVKTSEGDTPLSQLPYEFAQHLTKQGVGWGRCDCCKRRQWPNPKGPLHVSGNAPLSYFKGQPKDLKTLYSIAARVQVNGEWKAFIEQTTALTAEHARRIWEEQFKGPGNYKPHIIDAIGPTLGFYVNDKDGKDVSTS
jgi:hypothetical protein